MEPTTVTPVSVQVTRIIKAGQEEAFEQALREFLHRAREIPGQLSVHIVRPLDGSGSREYGVLRTFISAQARDDFYASELFRDHDANVARFIDGEVKWKDLCGLETWFTVPGSRAIVPPPRWKMAIVTFLGVYLTSTVIGRLAGPALTGFHPLLSSAVGIAITVVCLTWAVMPTLAKLFKPWLSPMPVSELHRSKAG